MLTCWPIQPGQTETPNAESIRRHGSISVRLIFRLRGATPTKNNRGHLSEPAMKV